MRKFHYFADSAIIEIFLFVRICNPHALSISICNA